MSGTTDREVFDSIVINIPFKTYSNTSLNSLTYEQAGDNIKEKNIICINGKFNRALHLLDPTDADCSVKMIGATTTDDGVSGYVPAPTVGDISKFLRGDGQWIGIDSEDKKVLQELISDEIENSIPIILKGANDDNTPAGTKYLNTINVIPKTGTLNATKFVGDGSELTNLNASNIVSGTLGDSFFPDTAITADSYGPTINKNLQYEDTFTVPKFTVDSKGRLTNAGNIIFKLPASDNTNTTYTFTNGTDNEIGGFKVKANDSETAEEVTVTIGGLGIANGIATLDENGKISSDQIADDTINSINVVKVNGNKLDIDSTDKSVNVIVPTKASDINAMPDDVTHLSGDIAVIEKGVANGVATLDSNGKITSDQIPDDSINVIDIIKVNGTALTPDDDKAVDITVPTKPEDIGAMPDNVTHLSGDIAVTEKGVANGVATLDNNAKIPTSQIPIASKTATGIVKVGDNISVDNNGVISTHAQYVHPETLTQDVSSGLYDIAVNKGGHVTSVNEITTFTFNCVDDDTAGIV